MIDIIKRDDVIKRQALDVQTTMDLVIEKVNSVLSSVNEFPIKFTDKMFIFYEDNYGQKTNPKTIIKVKNELFRLLRGSGWTIEITSDGFTLM